MTLTRTPRIGSLAGWTLVQAAVFWAWHAPALYAQALSSDKVATREEFRAVAKLNGGKDAEIVLKRIRGDHSTGPTSPRVAAVARRTS